VVICERTRKANTNTLQSSPLLIPIAAFPPTFTRLSLRPAIKRRYLRSSLKMIHLLITAFALKRPVKIAIIQSGDWSVTIREFYDADRRSY
jgi:hypothetical protein